MFRLDRNSVCKSQVFDMNYVRVRMKSILQILAVAFLLSGCMGISLISKAEPFFEEKWKEEVVLSNGKLIVVERATVPGRRFYSINGSSYSYEPEQTLLLPDGTLWSSLNLTPSMRMSEPALVDHDGLSWLIVVAPFFLGDNLSLGCPVPNFMYLRSSPTGWIRVNPTMVPDGLYFNLLMRSKQKQVSVVPFVSMAIKERIHADWAKEKQAEHEKTYFATGDRRHSWMERLSHLVHFSKYCDPNTSKCDQEDQKRIAQCDPSNLLIAPPVRSNP